MKTSRFQCLQDQPLEEVTFSLTTLKSPRKGRCLEGKCAVTPPLLCDGGDSLELSEPPFLI